MQQNKAKISENLEKVVLKLCPEFVKKTCNKILKKIPEKNATWIRSNKLLTICIAYAIRGLFFRPTMWPIYAGILAYFGFKN